MTNMIKFAADLEQELEILNSRMAHSISTAATILTGSLGRRHMGHNLGNAANEISEFAAKIEQTEMILKDLKNRIALAEAQ